MIPAVAVLYYGCFRHSLIAFFTLISHYSSNTYTRHRFLLVREVVCVPVSRGSVSGGTGELLPTSAEARRSDPRASGKSPAAFLLSDLGVDRYVPICIPSV